MLANSVKCLRSGRSAARSGCSFGGSFSHFGPPTEPKRIASDSEQTLSVEAVLTDAPGDIWREIKPPRERDRVTLKEVWLTHGHWDHTQGAAEVVRATQAKVRAHADDRALIETPEIMKRFMGLELKLEPV